MITNVCEWLDKTAIQYADKIAINDSDGQVTYRNYRNKSLAVARAIIDKKMNKRSPIVVFLEKSSKVLISFLGIAYSGNFYSPIDIDMPASRVNKILEILQPKLVITTHAIKNEFQKYNFHGEYLLFDDIIPSDDDEEIVKTVMNKIIDTDLLYVLFTSGSTGVPKGVGIRHRSVIDYINWVTNEFNISSEDSFGNQAPFYFDNSILDIYSCIKTGATLHIIPKELFAMPVKLLEYLKRERISTIFWVPSALIMVAKRRALRNIDLSDTIKRVLFCGEVMPNKQLNYWREALPDIVYSNLYGPTEITDACTYYTIDRAFSDEDTLPIGKPMKNTEVLVLDENNMLIDETNIDSVGELCVKGTCLAIGYYNNPEKTQEVFVQNPLHNFYEEKIYRTGDLVAYNSYGELVFLGRKDYQIKHMGHRIELGEIETAASSLDDISRCCCLYDDEKNRIVMVIEAKCEITKTDLNKRLAKLVPEYMLPGKVISIESMPLNANGKIDRVKLKENL